MDADVRIEVLLHKHADLEKAIGEEIQHPMPNQLRITELKREKLRIKDEIEKLQHA